jgi:hypothetical protein
MKVKDEELTVGSFNLEPVKKLSTATTEYSG